MDGHVWSNERKTPNGAGQCACALVGGLTCGDEGHAKASRPPNGSNYREEDYKWWILHVSVWSLYAHTWELHD